LETESLAFNNTNKTTYAKIYVSSLKAPGPGNAKDYCYICMQYSNISYIDTSCFLILNLETC